MARRNSFLAWRMLVAAEAQDERIHLRSKRSSFRASFDPVVDLGEVEFRNRYRLSKEAFLFLYQELECLTMIKATQQISVQTKVLVALFFFATGSYQRPVGVAKDISQKICSAYIHEVVQALTHAEMLKKYIVFPTTPSARRMVSQKFYTKYGIPGIVGCIDGSHIKIFSPPVDEEHLYYCRNHYHSINVQMVCDSDYRILSVNPKFGGANHDSFIWENSDINVYMQHLYNQGEMCWLLGDSGYPLRPWLITPFLEVNCNTPQAAFNQKHMTARVVIENTFGRIKNRWRCLCKDRVLHYKPQKCAQIIQACCVLHNIALDYGVAEQNNLDLDRADQDTEVLSAFSEASQPNEREPNELIRGRIVRDRLVQRLH